jgi:hypothetical protein
VEIPVEGGCGKPRGRTGKTYRRVHGWSILQKNTAVFILGADGTKIRESSVIKNEVAKGSYGINPATQEF